MSNICKIKGKVQKNTSGYWLAALILTMAAAIPNVSSAAVSHMSIPDEEFFLERNEYEFSYPPLKTHECCCTIKDRGKVIAHLDEFYQENVEDMSNAEAADFCNEIMESSPFDPENPNEAYYATCVYTPPGTPIMPCIYLY